MGSNKLFGTDGIRAHIASPHLQADNVIKLGQVLGEIAQEGVIVIGKDTRASGSYIEEALVAGISQRAAHCLMAGIAPTGAISLITRSSKACLGVMISASHNPYYDNGFKLFDSEGYKINSELKERIEKEYFSRSTASTIDNKIGRIEQYFNTENDYLSLIGQAFPKRLDLSGLEIVVDCAHGAAFHLAPSLLRHLGAVVHIIGCAPDGSNINDNCGSEAPLKLQEELKRRGAHVGLAFDGDADRMLVVDERGQVINGDAILATFAIDLKRQQRLAKNTMVATVMSSAALDRALKAHDIEVCRTQVGDQWVVQKMLAEGLSFGGESSGHTIIFPHISTGDAIFAALAFLDIVKRSKKSLSELVSFYQPIPTLLSNIAVAEKIPLGELPKTKNAIDRANDELSSLGRVMFRYSGTENKARLLVEAASDADCQKISRDILDQFRHESSSFTAIKHKP